MTTLEWALQHGDIRYFTHDEARAILLSQPEDSDVLADYARARDLSGWFSRVDEWNGPVASPEIAADELYEAYA